jgi:acyl transferase domain-containing protein
VIKVILALEKGVIPPNSENLQNLNPQIDEEFYNLKVSLPFLKSLPAHLT